MGCADTWGCDKCNKRVMLLRGVEFCRDENNDILPFGHPCPNEDGRKYGYKGIYDERYCPNCKKKIKVIVHELTGSSTNTKFWGIGDAYLGSGSITKAKGTSEYDICSDCGTELIDDLKNQNCLDNCGGAYSEPPGWFTS